MLLRKSFLMVAVAMCLAPVQVFAAEDLPVTTDEARDAAYNYDGGKMSERAHASPDVEPQDIEPAAGAEQEQEEAAQPSQDVQERTMSQKPAELPLTTDEARGAQY